MSIQAETGTPELQAETRLAWRVWRFDEAALTLLSLNYTGQRSNWIAQAMAYPVGGWPKDRVLYAECDLVGKPFPQPRGQGRKRKGEEEEEEARVHGRVPDPDHTCGIYGATRLPVIHGYLRPPEVSVLGIVEFGGIIHDHEQGYRAEAARVAGICLVDEQLVEPHPLLHELADAYNVPVLRPPWDDPDELAIRCAHPAQNAEFYRDQVTGMGAEAEMFLRTVTGLS
jgi:hypothetical protein